MSVDIYSAQDKKLLADICQLSSQAKQLVVMTVNAELTMMYWRIGRRIQQELSQKNDIDYVQVVLPSLSAKLVSQYGCGFSVHNLWRMLDFAESFADEGQVNLLAGLLSWRHFQELLRLKEPSLRAFYTQMCCKKRWSTATLHQQINSMLLERMFGQISGLTELANLERQNDLSSLFKDPYVLDFIEKP